MDKLVTAEDAIELLGCPFCGGDRITVWNIRDGRQAVCKDCHATGAPAFHGPNNDTPARAVAAWNTRAQIAPAQADPGVEAPTEAEINVVARAIYDRTHAGLRSCYSWDDAWEPHQEHRRDQYLKDAKAAIIATRSLARPPHGELVAALEKANQLLGKLGRMASRDALCTMVSNSDLHEARDMAELCDRALGGGE